MNRDDDQHDEGDNDESVDGEEKPANSAVPAEPRMRCAEDALGEDDVDDEQQHHAGGHEDRGGNREAYIGDMGSPRDSNGVRGYASHAEAKGDAGEDEFVLPSQVHLEDGHVCDGADEEEDQEHGRNWNIGPHGRQATKAGRRPHIWSVLLRLVLRLNTRIVNSCCLPGDACAEGGISGLQRTATGDDMLDVVPGLVFSDATQGRAMAVMETEVPPWQQLLLEFPPADR